VAGYGFHLLDLHALLTTIIREFVDDADSVTIDLEVKPRITFLVSVAATDLGKVIGKEGRTAKALRTFLHAAGSQMATTIGLSINN
jgi:predicted RNA-binding protein YlqC (UPF0109 family)